MTRLGGFISLFSPGPHFKQVKQKTNQQLSMSDTFIV